jgi:hypothetical protein
MPLSCTAIIGFLCVQAPIPGTVDVKLEDQGLWVANLVKTPGWTAEWGMSMEHAPPLVDPARMAKACEGGACVGYWRQCVPGKDGIACRFLIDREGAAVSVSVVAKDPAALDQALKALGVVAKWKEPVVAVPLAAMSIESKGEMPVK